MDAVLAVFNPAEHLSGVLCLCRAEGWSSYADHPDRTVRALTAPGVLCLVALDGGGDGGDCRAGVQRGASGQTLRQVVGAIQAQTDGVIQAHLSLLVVARRARGRGLGRRLVAEVLARSGAQRMDLLSEEAAAPFYERLPHRRMPGYRIYRPSPGGSAP